MDRNLKHRRENSAIREGLKTEEEKSSEPMKHNDRSNRILFVTHFNVFLYAACFFIQTGTLPYLTKKFGADPVTFGKLQTAFSVCQLVGGPLYGRIGDIFGEKVAIILALLSTTLTYLFTGLSYNMTTLFFSRLFSVMMHVMQGSQMVATTLSNDKNRAGALARLGFSYGLGMVVGPTLGGVVTKNFGEQAAALLAASGAFLSLVLVVVFVPNIKKERKQHDKGIMDLKKMGELVCLPAVRGILLIKELYYVLYHTL